MPAQHRSQGLADLSHRSFSALQETDDPQLEGQYGGFKCVNLGSIGHELRVFGDKLLVCMCFRCVKISFLLSEILMNLAYAKKSARRQTCLFERPCCHEHLFNSWLLYLSQRPRKLVFTQGKRACSSIITYILQ